MSRKSTRSRFKVLLADAGEERSGSDDGRDGEIIGCVKREAGRGAERSAGGSASGSMLTNSTRFASNRRMVFSSGVSARPNQNQETVSMKAGHGS